MRALSIWQPWASFIAAGLKQYETRSWSTKYRGPLLICAGQKRLTKAQFCDIWYYIAPAEYENLPFGKALCVVDLVSCLSVTHPQTMGQVPCDCDEFKLGDYTPGRFAWELGNVRRFKTPFAVKGQQGLFDWPDEIALPHELEVSERSPEMRGPE